MTKSSKVTCPMCGTRVSKSKPLPDPKREKLFDTLYRLSAELSYLEFEDGRAFEQEQHHRLALQFILRTNRKLAKDQKRLRLKIAGVKKALQPGASQGKA